MQLTRVGAGQVRVGPLLLVQLGKYASLDETVLEEKVLVLGTVHPVDVLGLHDLDVVVDIVVDLLRLNGSGAVDTNGIIKNKK